MANYWSQLAPYFTYFGFACAAYFGLRFTFAVLFFIKNYVLAKSLKLGKDVKSMGQWAVVTGSTDGIGKAYAEELASQGLDVVLISRSQDKLNAVAKEIESQFNIKTKTIAADFTKLDIYDNIRIQLEGLDIAVLVNNVGMSYEYPSFYQEIDFQTVERLVTVNCQSVAMMTKIVLPGMIAKEKGAIINISSASASKPTPMLTLYSGTKAFVDFFSRALQAEVADKNVIVQCVMPSFVATKMAKVKRHSFMIPGPNTYVKSALATLGLQTRTFGYVSHGLQWELTDLVPESLYLRLTLTNLTAIRNRALKKKGAEKSNKKE